MVSVAPCSISDHGRRGSFGGDVLLHCLLRTVGVPKQECRGRCLGGPIRTRLRGVVTPAAVPQGAWAMPGAHLSDPRLGMAKARMYSGTGKHIICLATHLWQWPRKRLGRAALVATGAATVGIVSRASAARATALEPEDSPEAVSWRRKRLERELLWLGLDPAILESGHQAHDLVQPVWHVVSAFLSPASPEARAAAWLPGSARTVAATMAMEMQLAQLARAKAAAGLRNHDRSEEELRISPPGEPAPLTVVMDDLEANEVGCLLRTCEAARVSAVLLCGDTPGPPDRQVLKTSLRAEDFVPHKRAPDIVEALRELRAKGFAIWLLAAHGGDASVPCGVVLGGDELLVPPKPLALALLGSSGAPDAEVIAMSDAVVRLPAYGRENALSGAISGSVAVYEILSCWGI